MPEMSSEATPLAQKPPDSVGLGDDDHPLVVDLDSVLLASNLFLESYFSLFSVSPFRGVRALGSLRHGRKRFSARLYDEAVVDFETLPLNEALLSFLRGEKHAGRNLVLLTDGGNKLTQAIFDRVGLFDRIIRTNGSSSQAEQLRMTFGKGTFDYVGSDNCDIEIWENAHSVLIASNSGKLIGPTKKRFPDATVVAPRSAMLSDYLWAIRPHQWLKNLLVFVPGLTAHHFDMTTGVSALLGFISFSLCASSVYVLNDLLDLRTDRNHPTKRMRPLASGQVHISYGVVLFPILLLLAVAVSLTLPRSFLLTLTVYYGLTLAYSTFLKRKIALDVVALASLYGMRLVGGGAAVKVPLSPWLLIFAIFVFLTLALVKRWSELVDRVKKGKSDPVGRGYRLADLPVIQAMATASGYVSVLTIGLYINSPTVSSLYQTPDRLWAIPLILLYWVSRVLILTHRGEMHDDPVVFAATDRTSVACAVLMVLTVLAGL